jgi:hypothetical protein
MNYLPRMNYHLRMSAMVQNSFLLKMNLMMKKMTWREQSNYCLKKKTMMTNGPEHCMNSFLHLNRKDLPERYISVVATVGV